MLAIIDAHTNKWTFLCTQSNKRFILRWALICVLYYTNLTCAGRTYKRNACLVVTLQSCCFRSKYNTNFISCHRINTHEPYFANTHTTFQNLLHHCKSINKRNWTMKIFLCELKLILTQAKHNHKNKPNQIRKYFFFITCVRLCDCVTMILAQASLNVWDVRVYMWLESEHNLGCLLSVARTVLQNSTH